MKTTKKKPTNLYLDTELVNKIKDKIKDDVKITSISHLVSIFLTDYLKTK